MILSHSPVLIRAPTEPYGCQTKFHIFLLATQISDPNQKIRDFPKMQISSSSHSHKYLTYTIRWISNS